MANISTTVDLVINRLSQAKYEQLCAAGQLEENQLYMTTGEADITAQISDEYYLKSETSSASEISNALSAKQSKLTEKQLSDINNISSLASYGWVEENYISSIPSSYAQLSDVSKVYVKDPSISSYEDGIQSDLSVIKLTNEEYAQMLSANAAQPNALYVISGAYKDAYGRQIKNVADATDLSDAVTLQQLQNATLDLSSKADISSVPLSTSQLINDSSFISSHQSLSNYYKKSETSSAIEISNALSGFSNVVLSYNGVSSLVSSLVINIVSKVEYDAMISAGTLLSDQMYIVSSLQLDARDDYVTNVKTPALPSDAANKAYVDSQISSIDFPMDLSGFTNSPGYIQASAFAQLFQNISNPKNSVNSVAETLISILNVLKGLS